MARPRKDQLREDMASDIKTVARAQMQAKGTAGLSLRAIARELGVTAPAIYNYFPRLDDLITALIVDAYNDLAESMQAAFDAVQTDAMRQRMGATLHAYRDWALKNPAMFQLIYGNPIPGYEAPSEVTVPLAARPFEIMGQAVQIGLETGEMHMPEAYAHVTEPLAQHAEAIIQQGAYPIAPETLVMLIATWTRIHGMVILEVIGHTPPTVGDPDAFFTHEVDLMLAQMGFDP